MNTPEQPPLHEQMVSDEYWEGPLHNPLQGLDILDAVAYKFEGYGVVGDIAKTKEIGRLALSMRGGGKIQTLAEGEGMFSQ